MRRLSAAFLVIMGCAAGCTLAVPAVTPTVAPTQQPSDTPFIPASPTLTLTVTTSSTARPVDTSTTVPTSTVTASLTHTRVPTQTPSLTLTPTNSNTPVPSATITPSPTLTPTPTVTPSHTNTSTATATLTPSATDTAVPSATRTFTATSTWTPSATSTFTATDTPSATITPSPSATATATERPSPTPLPLIIPTATDTPTNTPSPVPATATPTASPAPSSTWTLTPSTVPTFTPFPSPTVFATPSPGFVPLGERPELTLTAESLLATAQAITTLSAVASTTPTAAGFPTITPQFVTQPPGTETGLRLTPTPGGTLPPADGAGEVTVTAILPSSTPLPTEIALIGNQPQAAPTAGLPGFRSYALTTAGGSVVGTLFEPPGGAVSFSINPADGRAARINTQGSIVLAPSIVDGGTRLTRSPFSEFEPQSADDNSARVVQVAWSPDGRYLAFLVDTDSDAATQNDASNDGVWFLSPAVDSATDPTYQLTRDCPPDIGCSLLNAPYERRRSLDFQWNFQSTALLVRTQLVDEGRIGFVVVDAVADPAYSSAQRPVQRYEYASWVPDRNSIIGSGIGPDGFAGVWRINRDDGSVTLIFDGSGGLYPRSAVERTNGRVYMLASTTGPAGAVALYDAASGAPLTAPIGSSAPVRVDWSPTRDAVLVVTLENGVPRYFVAEVNGSLNEISQQVADAIAVEWVTQLPPASAAGADSPAVQAPGLTSFQPGQQIYVVYPGGLFLRSSPSFLTDDNIVAGLYLNDALTVLSGPVEGDGLRWYSVQTANNEIGFVAEGASGVPYLGSIPVT